jgi:glycosyltransferase involved in cell wall biosynthesis
LFVAPWELDYGAGVNHVITNLWDQVDRHRQFRALIMVKSWEEVEPQFACVDGRATIRLRLRDPWHRDAKDRHKHLVGYLVNLPSALRRLSRLLQQRDIRVVNVHYPGLGALVFVLLHWLRLFRGKIVLSFHGTDIRDARHAKGLERWAWRTLLGSADACVAVSGNLASEIASLCPTANVVTIRNGLDIAAFMAERDCGFELEPRLRERPYIVSVAAFVELKGHDTLLQAFAGIATEFPELQLVLIGGVGPHGNAVRREIARLQLDRKVVMIEGLPHNRVAQFLESAVLFVLASRKEAFGIVLLEAGAFGLPVVATRVGGIPEVITDGETGRLVPPDDPEALRAAIIDLLRSPHTARRLGDNLRRHAAKTFTWTRAYERYSELVANRSATNLD